MLPVKQGKKTQVAQLAAASLLAVSLSACSAAGLVGQVSSRLNPASQPREVAAQTTTQPPVATATTAPAATANVVTTGQDQLYEELYTKSNPSVVNITVIIGSASNRSTTPNNPRGSGVGEALGSG